VDGIGLSRLLETRQIKKMIYSYVGKLPDSRLGKKCEVRWNPPSRRERRLPRVIGWRRRAKNNCSTVWRDFCLRSMMASPTQAPFGFGFYRHRAGTCV